MPDQVEKLELFLRKKFDEVVSNANQPPQEMVVTEPFTSWEEKYLLRGLDEELFAVDDRGYVQSDVLPPPAGKSARQKMLQLFWNHGDDKRGLFREGVNQLATAARLIYEYGWDKSEIRMEPTIKEFGTLAYGVDIICLDSNGKIPLCCENKRNSAEFERLIVHFKSCASVGRHSKDECSNPSNHPKYEFCMSARPRYIWFVAPAAETCLKLGYAETGQILMSPMQQLIPRKEVLNDGSA